MSAVLTACALLCPLALAAKTMTFYSRPELSPPVFNFSVYQADRLSPGYILMSPYTGTPGGNLNAGSSASSSISSLCSGNGSGLSEELSSELNPLQNGPYIYDTDGTLIWSGYGSAGGQYSHDVKVAKIHGKSYLTFFNGEDPTSGARGEGVVLDTSYRTIDTIHTGNGRAPNDIHEFTRLDDGTARTTIFQPSQYNLRPEGLQQPWGYVVQGIAQVLDVVSGDVVFEWQSLDHVNPFDTYHPYNISDTSGNGTSPSTAWDFFHMNSIDQFANGDYLLSSRYMCTLYRIDGKTGNIVWQLGGRHNQFDFVGFNDSFAFQHHARIHSEIATTIVISIFDNGSDGYVTRSKYSSGIIMALDTSTMTNTLLKQLYLPEPVLSTSQGSTQLLTDGNIFMGWGSQPYISEFSADGECVMAASFGSADDNTMSYRAFKIDKSDWIGQPQSTPAIWAYANGTSTPVEVFASWNGATEIASWRFYGHYGNSTMYQSAPSASAHYRRPSAQPSSSLVLGTVPKAGFETSFTADKYYPYTVVEALDKDGRSLGFSPSQKTYLVN